MNDLPDRIAKLSPAQRELLWRELQKQRAAQNSPAAQTLEKPAMSTEKDDASFHSPLEEVLAVLWEDHLQREHVEPFQTFGDLGGNNNLAVAMLGNLQRLLALARPFTDFTPEMTVRKLAQALQQQERQAYQPIAGHGRFPSLVIALQPLGSQPPLFCVHPVGGDVSCYAPLARCLGNDQPLYGLQAQGMNGECEPTQRIEDMARTYIRAISQIALHGPYRLCGWSMGGVVAFEMARQLSQQQQNVDFLGLLDTPVTVPAHMIGNHTRLLLNFVQNAFPLNARELVNLTPGRQIRLLLEKVQTYPEALQTSSPLQWLSILHVYRCNAQAQQNYRPQPYAGRLTLLHAEQLTDDPLDPPAEPERWDHLALQGVDVRFIAGNHGTILSKPFIQQTATHLQACLQQLTER